MSASRSTLAVLHRRNPQRCTREGSCRRCGKRLTPPDRHTTRMRAWAGSHSGVENNPSPAQPHRGLPADISPPRVRASQAPLLPGSEEPSITPWVRETRARAVRCIPRRDAARAHCLVPAGRGGGEHVGSGRQRALLAGSSLMTRPLALVIRPEAALAVQALVHDDAHAPSSAPPQPGAPETARLWCRRGALRAPGVQNGGDQPEHHAARHRSTPEKQRNHAKNTRPSHGFLELPGPPRL